MKEKRETRMYKFTRFLICLLLADLQLDIEAEGDLTERDGHKYLRLKSFNVIPQIGDLKFEANNILPDAGLSKCEKSFYIIFI